MADMLHHFLARVPCSTATGGTRTRAANRSEEISKVLPIPEPEEARTGQGRQAQTELGAHLQLLNLNLRSGKTTLPIGGRLAPPVFQRQLVTSLPGPVDPSLNTGIQIGFHIPTCTALHTRRAESTPQDPATGGQGGAEASGKESDKAGDNGSGAIRQQALHSPKE